MLNNKNIIKTNYNSRSIFEIKKKNIIRKSINEKSTIIIFNEYKIY